MGRNVCGWDVNRGGRGGWQNNPRANISINLLARCLLLWQRVPRVHRPWVPTYGGEAGSSGECICPALLGGAFTLKPTDNLLAAGEREAWGGGQLVVA